VNTTISPPNAVEAASRANENLTSATSSSTDGDAGQGASPAITVAVTVSLGIVAYAIAMVMLMYFVRRWCKQSAEPIQKTVTVVPGKRAHGASPPSSSSPSASECEVEINVDLAIDKASLESSRSALLQPNAAQKQATAAAEWLARQEQLDLQFGNTPAKGSPKHTLSELPASTLAAAASPLEWLSAVVTEWVASPTGTSEPVVADASNHSPEAGLAARDRPLNI